MCVDFVVLRSKGTEYLLLDAQYLGAGRDETIFDEVKHLMPIWCQVLRYPHAHGNLREVVGKISSACEAQREPSTVPDGLRYLGPGWSVKGHRIRARYHTYSQRQNILYKTRLF
jgi:hypothetical protein